MIPSSPSLPAVQPTADAACAADHYKTDAALLHAAQWLRDRYHGHPHLPDEQRGWNLRLTVQPSDAGSAVLLDIRDGHLVEILTVSQDLPMQDVSPPARSPGDVRSPQPGPHVHIQGPLALLCDVLRLRQPPSEPYLFGELLVLGPEPEFLRLDYIVSTLAHSQETP